MYNERAEASLGKHFNIAGPCVASDHYMIPTERRCADLHSLVENHQYFVIHAPRQMGKTTLIQDFVRVLNKGGRYLALYCSIETVQSVSDPSHAIQVVLAELKHALKYSFADDKDLPVDPSDPSEVMLRNSLSAYCAELKKPLVILFDEVDCLVNGALISFLRQLRNGFIGRAQVPFVHSIGLVGMRNIRDYQTMIREERDTLGSASPFNIVSRALTLSNFTHAEVTELLGQHTAEGGVAFPSDVISLLYDRTQGQPWLVNALALELISGDAPINIAKVEKAIETLILRRDTHIDSLLERLKEPRVRRVLEPVILGERTQLDFTDDDLRYTVDLGLLRPGDGDLEPANPIYGEVIIRVLSLNSQKHLPESLMGRFIRDGVLDMSGLLREFQQFWRENSDIWIEKYTYREAAPQLILQAYLQRVVNGGARIEREYSAGRGRIDLCIALGDHRYPLELKIKRGADTVARGLEQLSAYMDRLAVKQGWLVVFDRDPDRGWSDKISWETHEHEGRTIHAVSC